MDEAEMARDLIVAAGEEVQLPARLHRFGTINIAKGGVVRIAPRSSRWSIWWAEGDVTIDGTVIGREFGRVDGAISEQTPDGHTVSYRFENAALGGDGGSGGASSQLGAGTRQGGRGARGDRDYGGGGGSGGGILIQGHATRLGSPGNDASDWRGAEPASDGGYDNRGGDGARAARHPNGALLLIHTPGQISGDGRFDFAGEAGPPGQRGASGFMSNRGTRGGSGGGGGAPGGDGGYLVVVAGALDHAFQFDAPEGAGGPGGDAGGTPRGATAGRSGEAGYAGTFDEFPIADWKGV